jgi:Adenosyl cobinamide kinase/adenosyl cobinamide phosphate guanylyltransferase
MSTLIVGGIYQGKLAYTEKIYSGEIVNGEEINRDDFLLASCINNLHLFIKKLLESGNSPEEVAHFIKTNSDAKILICDDICSGIVPIDEKENLWRETTGRLLCDLTTKADTVIRMQCGIPQTIKGKPKR